EEMYVPLAVEAWEQACKDVGVRAEEVDVAAVVGLHARSAKRVAGRLGAAAVADDLSATVGNTGAAHPALVLTDVLERARPGQVIALVSLADGAEVLVFRTTDALGSYAPARTVSTQLEHRAPVSYSKYL